MTRAAWVAAVVWLTTTASARHASAQDAPATVLLVVSECSTSPIDRGALAERLRVELTSDGVRELRLVTEVTVSPEAPELAVLHVDAAPCAEGSASFTLRIDDLLTGKHTERTIALTEVPEGARPRTIALSVAELLRASWAELAIVDPPPAAVPPAVLAAIRVRAAPVHPGEGTDHLADPAHRTVSTDALPPVPLPTREPRASLSAAFVARTFPGARTSPIGGRVSLDLFPLRELVVRIDAEAAVGASLDPLGTVELGLATLGVTLGLSAPVGDRVLISVGPRIAGGAAWASGRSYDPSTIASSGVGPLLIVGGAFEVDVLLAAPLSLRFGAGADAVAVGYQALVMGAPIAGISGGGVGAWAGAAVAL